MQLGKVEKLTIRDQWKNEEYEFTPWLAKEENIQLLGDEINLDLEVEDTEVSIGSYKADIVARDGNSRTVIIENQLEKTDHKHLGQMIEKGSSIILTLVSAAIFVGEKSWTLVFILFLTRCFGRLYPRLPILQANLSLSPSITY